MLELGRALDWVHEHANAPPRQRRPLKLEQMVAPTVETSGDADHRMVCYDSHTLEHTGKSLQASVKICVRTVCSTLSIDGAEAWFALPKQQPVTPREAAAPPVYAYSYLVVSQLFQQRYGSILAYPPDKDPARHKLSTAMCDGVAHTQEQVCGWERLAVLRRCGGGAGSGRGGGFEATRQRTVWPVSIAGVVGRVGAGVAVSQVAGAREDRHWRARAARRRHRRLPDRGRSHPAGARQAIVAVTLHARDTQAQGRQCDDPVRHTPNPGA